MVNLSTLEKLIRFTKSKKLSAMKKWSDRYRVQVNNNKSSIIKKMCKNIRTLLNLISGNDLVEMLKGN